jgi:hypothetical protein
MASHRLAYDRHESSSVPTRAVSPGEMGMMASHSLAYDRHGGTSLPGSSRVPASPHGPVLSASRGWRCASGHFSPPVFHSCHRLTADGELYTIYMCFRRRTSEHGGRCALASVLAARVVQVVYHGSTVQLYCVYSCTVNYLIQVSQDEDARRAQLAAPAET